ncbi:MAG TPA: NAD(P)/FAD-dependent oxidoreductase, partial [Candidatus Lustribacter sp.]|nr:NAD(P)/FAD-dependent oxidoreductase [Candidatus Lustribacter sp.]
SRWPADVSVQGARVAVIGTGASAIQVVPGIVDDVAHLGVFQRSAPWVLRRGDRPIRPGTRRLYARLPAVYAGVRAATRVSRELNTPVFTESSPIGRVIERMARAHMQSVVTDPALRAKLTPSYRVGCKRILISDDYYPALTHEHVDVVTDPIERVSATGVLTRDPKSGALVEHPVDVMVLATGFLPSRPPVADKVVGVDGRTLARLWDARGVHAYKGTAVPGYPNLFFLVGPNTGLGHTSMLLMIEAQVAYVAEAVRLVREGTARRVEVTPAATTAWNDELQRRLAKSIWATGGCSSWYVDEHGRNVTLWPGTTWSFERAVKTFDRDAYLTA